MYSDSSLDLNSNNFMKHINTQAKWYLLVDLLFSDYFKKESDKKSSQALRCFCKFFIQMTTFW